jgi:hypothetical protein
MKKSKKQILKDIKEGNYNLVTKNGNVKDDVWGILKYLKENL